MMSVSGFAFSQQIPVSTIDINNVRGTVLGIGSSYSALLDNEQIWEVPKGSGKSPLFQYSLWIGGKDINNQLHLAANKYNQEGRDYWMGPLTFYGYTNLVTEQQYEHIWKLSRVQIEDFIANHDQPGYKIPEDILTWPAHGPLTTYAPNLAPFVDVDGDGHYSPQAGDYPSILGDQCLFFIFNDCTSHTESGGNDLGVEVQAMVYAFDEPSDETLNNTVFFHYDIINRSTKEYVGTYFGIWNDWNIGVGNDDYVGCNVSLGACYAYNGTPVDGNGEPEAYGDNPPVQLLTLLAGPYKDMDGVDDLAYSGDCDGFNNYFNVNYGNGIVDDERLGMSFLITQSDDIPEMGDPENAEEFYRLLRGCWKDGNRAQYGGNGYPGSSGVVGPACNFMFPGDSDPCNFGTNGEWPNCGYNLNGNYWTEAEAGNEPGERSGLAVTGPFWFRPHALQPLDFAMTTVWGTETQSALDRVESAVFDVKQKFEEYNVMAISEHPSVEEVLLVYPNPSEGITHVKGSGRLTLTNTLGQVMMVRDIEGEMTLTLSAGLYYLRIENENGNKVAKVVVR